MLPNTNSARSKIESESFWQSEEKTDLQKVCLAELGGQNWED